MFYVKNVPGRERALRAVVGIGALGFAALDRSGVGIAAGLAGAMLALTGLVGWCPMCALPGRKLERRP